jgi:hypothetical protein
VSRRGATHRLVVGTVAVAALMAGAACTTSPSTESPSPAAPQEEAPTQSPTRPPRLPLAEGRLEGKYEVRLFTTSNSFDSKPLQDQLFRFLPRCDEGSCDVSITGRMGFGQGLEDREQAGAEKRFDLSGQLRCYRIGHAVGDVGIDAPSGVATNVYSVITELNGDLVSAYPGFPAASESK